MHLPELVAHRGFAAEYPENTLAAVDAAIAAGAAHVEIDVQLSKDGVPVLFHDRTLARMCGVAGTIHERTLAELAALSAGEAKRFGARFEAERIATLEGFAELLARHPHVHAFVEIKRAGLEVFGNERVLAAVLRALDPVLARCSLISFSLPFLAFVRKAHPIALGAVFDRWSQRTPEAVGAIDPQYVFCDLDGLSPTGPLEDEGRKIVIYEVADPKVALALAARGVDMVETFAIRQMIAAFRGLAPSAS